MDVLLSYPDLQHIIGVKLCFFVFIMLGIFAIYKKWKPWIVILMAGIICGIAYYILVDNTQLMFWGLTGDEITIAAMYEMFAHGSFFSDFAYAGLPPFYPPLWFQIFGVIGRFLNFNGVQIAKLASFSTISLFPIIVYVTQRWYWKYTATSEDGHNAGTIASMLVPLLMFVVVDWDAIITKPYELVSATLVILWTVFLVRDIHTQKFDWKKITIYGITGGILFLLFYFWFFLAAIGIALFNLMWKQKTTLRMYGQFILIALLIIVLGSWYWLPLARSYMTFGAENWQLGFFVIDWISTYGLATLLSWRGLIFLCGLTSLIIWRHHIYIRSLLSLFFASYMWQIMGMMTILTVASPLQESKGFMFFNQMIIVFAVSYSVERMWKWASKRYDQVHWQRSVALLGLFILSTQLIFGIFVDNEKVYAVRERSKEVPPYTRELIDALDSKDVYHRHVLSSGIPTLHAFLPLNVVLYFNQHNSHPAALFSQRVAWLKDVAIQHTPEQFFEKLDKAPFGPVDLFVFEKDGESGFPIYLNIDNFPYGIKETGFRLPSEIFVGPYVKKIFENNKYVVFERV